MAHIDEQQDENDGAIENPQARYTVLKLDLLLMPYLALLFLCNALDRANIGNAETANFTADIGLAPKDLNNALALFFAVYVSLHPLMAAMARRVGMIPWVPATITLWGLCTLLHVWIKAKWQFYALRVLIGVLEAGFYPVTVSYLSVFYTRSEFGKRLGFFHGQALIAGMLGGLISWAIFSTKSSTREGGLKSWQLLFLVEGVATMITAALGFFWLPHSPETAWFFSPAEREWARERTLMDRAQHQIPQSESAIDEGDADEMGETERLIRQESRRRSTLSMSPNLTKDKGIHVREIIAAVTEWKVWYILVINICSSIPSNAFAVFLPLIVRGMGLNPATANLMTVPPFLVGAVILAYAVWWSDHYNERLKPILFGLVLMLISLTATVYIPQNQILLRYLALCLLPGGYMVGLLTVAWLADNMEEPGKRAIVLGINGWGNLAGVVSSFLFAPRFAPTYEVSFFLTLAFVLVAFVGYVLFRWLIIRENAARARILSRWSEQEVEAERAWGKGPAPQRTKVLLMLFGPSTRVGVWLWDMEKEGRRGDEKITFSYGL